MDRAILSVLSEMTGENVFQVPTGMLTVSFFFQRSRLMRNCTVGQLIKYTLINQDLSHADANNSFEFAYWIMRVLRLNQQNYYCKN